MSKTQKILQIISVLNHRQYVTMDTIQSACKISERTAYRYLNTISEANIPVYFDKERRSYTLTRHNVVEVADLGLSEAVIISSALRLLELRVNEDYREEIEKLLVKVLLRQSQPVGEILEISRDVFDDGARSQECSDVLSTVLIQAALKCNKPVQLQTTGNEDGDETVTVQKPALAFKNGWRIGERNGDERQSAALDKVKKVTII